MPPNSPQFEIAAVLEELGFEEVPRVTSGHRKVRCAFHGDRNPSASVGRYSFVCFACGRQGDAIKLIREEEQLSYADAIARCEEITGGASRPVSPASGWGGDLLG